MTNDILNDNEDCLDLVADAMRFIESKNYDNIQLAPRKSLQDTVIVACSFHKGDDIQCFIPRENRWHSLSEVPISFKTSHTRFAPCNGKIYSVLTETLYGYSQMASYSLCSNNWMLLPYNEDRELKQLFVGYEDEMYALLTEPCKYHKLPPYKRDPSDFCGKEKHVSFISKYKPESNSREDISSFDHLSFRDGICIVAKDNFVYFIGGAEWLAGARHNFANYTYLTDVNRYDLSQNQWDKAADIQKARRFATGAVVSGKIFVADGLWHIES